VKKPEVIMELMEKTDAKASVERPLRHCPTVTLVYP
jgi:hypothetical protein